MKALIIILAVVFITFLGLLVYSTNRDEQPKRACERMPPSFNSKDGPSEDALEDWCPPDLAKSITRKTRGLQRRFVKGLDLETPAERETTPQMNVPYQVPPFSEETKAAKVTLISGNWAIAQNGKDRLCLCRPGAPLPGPALTSQCSDEWLEDHSPRPGQQALCQSNDDSGLLPFRRPGGVLELLPGPPAKVKIE